MICINQFGRSLLMVPAFIFLFNACSFAEEPGTTLLKIKNNYKLIILSANKFLINPKILSSIIYVERTLNYSWKDEALDNLLAENGLNSSIGFCQIKMKTAYWIEVQLSDSTKEYFPGNEYKNILKISKSPDEIIDKLNIDSLNILYAAAYLRIIQSRWNKAGFSIDNKTEIVGTLYSTGLFYRDGLERKPNLNPKPNAFGKKILESMPLFKF